METKIHTNFLTVMLRSLPTRGLKVNYYEVIKDLSYKQYYNYKY